MGVEIERRYLLKQDLWLASADRTRAKKSRFLQGYLSVDRGRTVRVRVEDGHAWITIKGEARDAQRAEYEYEIPEADGRELLALCVHDIIEKDRLTVEYEGMTWEVDEFDGANAGLMIAEIELEQRSATYATPPWAGTEITGDARYSNSALAQHPFNRWSGEV